MISAKKLMKMARKWQKVAAMKRKRISLPRTDLGQDSDCCSTSAVANKGHFVANSADRRRFVIPLGYLNNEVFESCLKCRRRSLGYKVKVPSYYHVIQSVWSISSHSLKMSEEEFGIQSEGPIILPCDSICMEYIISFIQRGVAKDLERALIISMTSSNYSSSAYFHQGHSNEQLLLCAF